MESSRMDGRSVLVTGGASGIGHAAARRLAGEGAHVTVSDADGDGAERVAAEIGGDCVARTLDVTDERAWDAAVDAVAARHGRLDALVHSAGISFAKPITDTTLEEWRHVQAINVDGAFLGIRAALRAMRPVGRGSIVIVSSASGLKASAGASAYCASKAGVRMLADAAALECARDGIRINTLHPAGVTTPMWTKMPFFADLVEQHGEEGAWSALSQDSPMGRFATPDEIAAAILFLVSDESSYVTASGLVIDGGYTA